MKLSILALLSAWLNMSFATYDILLKPSANFGPIKGAAVPDEFNELTFCTWFRFEGTWGDDKGNDVYLVRYIDKPGDIPFTHGGFETFIETYTSPNVDGIFFQFYFPTKGTLGRRIKINEMTDGKWNQICVSWSGMTGAASYYKNGKIAYSRSPGDRYRLSMKGGGRIYLGGITGIKGGGTGNREVTIHVTGVNLWNRVLSDQEIAKNAESCDAGVGNLMPWQAWYKPAGKSVRDKSQCKGPKTKACSD